MKTKTYSSRREFFRESGSVAALTGYCAFGLELFTDILKDIREGTYHARHAMRTSKEMLTGGPEGMKAAKKLEESLKEERYKMKLGDAIEVLREVNKENESASESLDCYFDGRITLVNELVGLYKQNETLANEAERLFTQLNGMVVNYTSAGDAAAGKITFGISKKLDDLLIRLGTKENPREELEGLKSFYRDVRQFYDAREKTENTTRELCDYLRQRKDSFEKQNADLNSHLDRMVMQLDETYKTEKGVMSIDQKVNLFRLLTARRKQPPTREELDAIHKRISVYGEDVDKAENTIMQDIPMEPYQKPKWLEWTINPLSIGLVAALALKGASSITRPTRRALTTISLLPVWYFPKSILVGSSRIYNLLKRKIIKAEGVKK